MSSLMKEATMAVVVVVEFIDSPTVKSRKEKLKKNWKNEQQISPTYFGFALPRIWYVFYSPILIPFVPVCVCAGCVFNRESINTLNSFSVKIQRFFSPKFLTVGWLSGRPYAVKGITLWSKHQWEPFVSFSSSTAANGHRLSLWPSMWKTHHCGLNCSKIFSICI